MSEETLRLRGTFRKDRHSDEPRPEPSRAPTRKLKLEPVVAGRDYLGMARGYAEGVRDGRILACRYVRQACAAFLSVKAAGYTVDGEKIDKVCAFVETLPHVKGKWARDRERIRLEPWQCFILANVFGVMRDGRRRYRRVYIEVPRKNAKSTLTAALGNYMLTQDDEHGAEVYSGATTEKQAWEVFGPARLMALGVTSKDVRIGAKNLSVEKTASKFEPIIGKPGDGASPSFSITDEYHEHSSPEQYDTMVSGMGAREQPIAWVITTAGSDTAGPCYALRQQAMDSLEGKVAHDELFAIIYTIDPDVDWTSETALRMANPNMGVSVFEEFLRGEQARAIKDPREQSRFKTKHLDLWVTAASPYFNAELLKRLGDPTLKPENFAGEPCVLAFDLASKLDLASVLTLFAKEIDDERHYYAFSRNYCPENRAHAPERRHYAAWAEQGYLTLTPGDITNYDYIEADIKADVEQFQVLQIGGDPWNATQVLTHLQDYIGADRVVEVPQTVSHLSEPMKEIQAAIVAGRFHHDGNPCFEWAMGNVTAQVDRNDNVFPRKEHEDRKIDPAVACIIAMNRGLAAFEDAGSIYDQRGLLAV